MKRFNCRLNTQHNFGRSNIGSMWHRRNKYRGQSSYLGWISHMGRFDMKDIRIRNKLENGYLCAATLIERKPEDKTCSYGPAGAVQSFPT